MVDQAQVRYADVNDCQIVSLPKIIDRRGNLTFIEGDRHVPFAVERVYWIYDVPGGEVRDGHAHAEYDEMIIALSGSFDVCLDDATTKRTVTLNRSYFGLLVPRMTWRSIENTSTNSVCLVLASGHHIESKNIRDYEEFVRRRRCTGSQ
jgi:hypothetical protein